MSLKADISSLWEAHEADEISAASVDRSVIDTLEDFLTGLETGEIRAAEKENGEWVTNYWVKQGILLNFILRDTEARVYGDVTYHDVLPLQDTEEIGARRTRNTPDGTVIRRGAYIGSNAILMSPSFVNIGAFVGDETLVDSCDTVGSCAQVGANVKIGGNVLIGGVLEPVEEVPVVVEDNVALGGGCRVTSGFVVGENSIVGENTLLTPRIPVYDLVEETVLYGELPPNRRAFTRFVKSDISSHELFEGGAYKPAVVATDIETETIEATTREDALRE